MGERITLTGPWQGMEERVAYQQPGHCALALNVSFHRGTISPRRGFKTVSRLDEGRGGFPDSGRSQISIIKDSHGKSLILQVGSNHTGNGNIWACVSDLQGLLIEEVNLTSKFGEPSDPYFKCSLVKTRMRGIPSVLVSTPNSTYIFRTDGSCDPADSEWIEPLSTDKLSSLTGGTTDGDAIKDTEDAGLYHSSSPRGFAEAHNMRVYYVSPGYQALLAGELPADQDDIREDWVDPVDRRFVLFPDSAVIVGDPYDPAGLFAPTSYIPKPGEKVVACKSFNEKLVIFTEDGISVAHGDPDFYLETPLVEVSSGHGLVAPLAVVEAAGVLFYLSDDGIYAFGGDGVPQKLSKGLDSLWTGYAHGDRISPALSSLMKDLGWPWKVSNSRVEQARAAHLKEENLLLFNLPVGVRASTGSNSLDEQWITVVYDYSNQAFSIWARRDMKALFWGHERHEGRDFFTTGTDGNLIATYGEGKDDLGDGIPVAYQSVLVPAANEDTVVFRGVNFHMMSVGKNYTTNSPQWFIEGSQAAFDEQLEGENNSNRQASTGTLDLHPHQDNDYFADTAVLGTTPLSSKAFFSSRAAIGPILDKWVAVGYVDDANAEDRGPVVDVRAIAIFYEPTGRAVGGVGR